MVETFAITDELRGKLKMLMESISALEKELADYDTIESRRSVLVSSFASIKGDLVDLCKLVNLESLQDQIESCQLKFNPTALERLAAPMPGEKE